MKRVISALLCHLQIYPSYFRIDVIIPQTLNFWACFRTSDTGLDDKPGTNLNKMVDLSSNRCVLGHYQATASNSSTLDLQSRNEKFGPVVSLAQIRVVNLGPVVNLVQIRSS